MILIVTSVAFTTTPYPPFKVNELVQKQKYPVGRKSVEF